MCAFLVHIYFVCTYIPVWFFVCGFIRRPKPLNYHWRQPERAIQRGRWVGSTNGFAARGIRGEAKHGAKRKTIITANPASRAMEIPPANYDNTTTYNELLQPQNYNRPLVYGTDGQTSYVPSSARLESPIETIKNRDANALQRLAPSGYQFNWNLAIFKLHHALVSRFTEYPWAVDGLWESIVVGYNRTRKNFNRTWINNFCGISLARSLTLKLHLHILGMGIKNTKYIVFICKLKHTCYSIFICIHFLFKVIFRVRFYHMIGLINK